LSKTVKKKNEKTLILGFPGNGLIGTITISYIISHLQMRVIGEINHSDMPPTLFVENGEIIGPIRIYKKGNLYAIISDIPIYPEISYEFIDSVARYCRAKKITKVLVPSGVDTDVYDGKNIKTYGLATHDSLDKLMYENDISKFLAGSIVGTDATVIIVFRNYRIPLLILYTQCHPYFPDPQASVYAITSLAKVLKVDVDTADIQKRIDYLKIQHRTLMQELQTLQQQEKQASKAPPIYR
jgi:uncharacterized protein